MKTLDHVVTAIASPSAARLGQRFRGEIARNPQSYTGQYLKPTLAQKVARVRRSAPYVAGWARESDFLGVGGSRREV